MAELPDRMPEGCNFYGLLETAQEPAAVARQFESAGWRAEQTSGTIRLEIGWARLTLENGSPMILRGWIDPPERVAEVLALLQRPGLQMVSQWINEQGQLWRDMPFDPAMLDPDDPRLPAEIKESIRQSKLGAVSLPKSRKPWWKFWS